MLYLFLFCHVGLSLGYGGGRIGFSLILVDNMKLANDSRIGHLNFITCKSLKMKSKSFIGHLNVIKGYMDVLLDENAEIYRQNIIRRQGISLSYKPATFVLGKGSQVMAKHYIDVTTSISFGDGTTLAGLNSELWTHGFIFGKEKKVRLDSSIIIGDNCYIGSSCIFLPGSKVGDNIIIGAGAIVCGVLDKKGMYVGAKACWQDYDADERIHMLGCPKEHIGDVDIFEK